GHSRDRSRSSSDAIPIARTSSGSPYAARTGCVKRYGRSGGMRVAPGAGIVRPAQVGRAGPRAKERRMPSERSEHHATRQALVEVYDYIRPGTNEGISFLVSRLTDDMFTDSFLAG